MIIIGLTGSIGMGKSTVAEMLRDRGVPVHDADAAVHRLLGPGGGAVGIVGQEFPGVTVVDGEGVAQIDRAALGRIVFADRAARKKLEELLHPLVRAQSDRFVADHRRQGAEMVALDIPLLFETGGEKRVDVTLCVSANAGAQESRVLARPGMTREKFDRIVAGQMPDAEKRKRADHVLATDQTLAETAADLDRLLEEIRLKNKGKF
jgi:dephospho-CoA kinase